MRPSRILLSNLHNDLSTYLSYVRRTGLDTASTTAVGTLYEYTVQAALKRWKFTLHHTGGRMDHGIDLLGTWKLPSLPPEHPLRVIVQCKALQQRTGPVLIRELEGAFTGAPMSWRRNNIKKSEANQKEGKAELDFMAILAATKAATQGIKDALVRSNLPMAYIHMSSEGILEQMIWNDRASLIGLQGLGVTSRYLPGTIAVGGDQQPTRKEAVLTWGNQILDAV